ncbi:alpha-1,6-glucosidase domain-containing protein [Niveibacterium sp. SC-1]|uniref:alpha-1,6-glucosidase domain-containing protein n=1 Tax=Niveibacterium sp. SC-1 TaxID=3135646 RepID=UPI00311F3B6B
MYWPGVDAIVRRFGVLLVLVCAAILAGCGDGSGGHTASVATSASPLAKGGNAAEDLAYCDAADFQTVLSPVPVVPGPPTTLTVHYHRNAADYAGWQIHTWNAGKDPGWNQGWNAAGADSFGVVYNVPLVADSGPVGFIFHSGDAKDNGGADQSYTLHAGANEIWRLEGDSTNYASNPLAGPPDLTRIRVHYKRSDGNYAAWGLHLWEGSGLNAAALQGVTISDWNNPVPFAAMPAYSLGAAGVVFDIPVLNPKDDASRTSLQFIIHGMPPNQNDKDGRNDNIVVNYQALAVSGGVGDIWLLQGDPTVYTAMPDSRSVSTSDARAYWLAKNLIQWPKIDSTGVFKLYYSGGAQIVAMKDAPLTGAEGSLTLSVSAAALPPDVATRFKWVPAGVLLKLAAADVPKLREVLTKQLVIVQEDANGKVQNATTLQNPGVLDDLYAAATGVDDLGATFAHGRVSFKLWAPTAQQVKLCTYQGGSSAALGVAAMSKDAATGVWSVAQKDRQIGSYYAYLVDVFVPGVGIVRNRVTDPYSLGLTTDSRRSYIADLDSPALKPHGWEGSRAPRTTTAQEDMVIYELHVRDFSVNDETVPDAHRGKYLAFTDERSDGMKHLRALGRAGLTDVHLLPVFDIATIPETGCVTPAIPPDTKFDSPAARDAINAVKDQDCFNWGYDPFHYTVPEGSYASDAADGAARIREFRAMVKSLHEAGLRVGMDVVYNHTSASGQDAHSVLDRVVPGYYHRLDGTGKVLNDTCCADTAAENAMMARLMIDSVKTWAVQYKIDSFRFDLMAFHPRAVMEQLKAEVNKAVQKEDDHRREVFFVGEGWNFGAVADGARFVQASQLSLNGSGIGTFSDRARDAVRGGGPFDGGQDIVRNQGYVTGLFYDDNGSGAGKTRADLLRSADMLRAGLAGSIRDYSFTNYLDVPTQLQQIDYNGQPAGYVLDPQEVVNYFENHDNQTLFDVAVQKLPTATTLDDRARVQMLAAAINAFSQGVAYFHAGVDTLRSKSFDNNSYNSGDWFNRLDWTYASNNFAVGLPVAGDDALAHQFMAAAVAPGFTPGVAQITSARDVFRDLLAIRSSTPLFRLHSGEEIKARLKFYNTGSAQIPTVLVGHLDGRGYRGRDFGERNYRDVLYFVNVDKVAQTVAIAEEAGKRYELHPVQASFRAADKRVRDAAGSTCTRTGSFTIPARSAVVCVVD